MIPEVFERDYLRPLLEFAVGKMGGTVETLEYDEEHHQLNFHSVFDVPPDPVDMALLRQIVEGNRDALTEFMRRHGR